MLRGKRLHMARKFLHIGRVASLATKRNDCIMPFKRLCKSHETRLSLIDRQKVDGVVGLRPDEAVHAAVCDELGFFQKSVSIETAVLAVRHGKNRKWPANPLRRNSAA